MDFGSLLIGVMLVLLLDVVVFMKFFKRLPTKPGAPPSYDYTIKW